MKLKLGVRCVGACPERSRKVANDFRHLGVPDIIRPPWTWGLGLSSAGGSIRNMARGPPDSALAVSARARPDLLFGLLSLLFQIRGLIGPDGILPAGEYLEAVARHWPRRRFWFAPTLLWISTSPHMLMAICWAGMIASLLLVVNVWPRAMLLVCFVCFLSFVSAAQDFSGYQSDGMLLEAGFISLFFAPPGFRPGLGTSASAVARQPVPAAMGVVPHLLRIGRGEAGQRRSRVAQLHRHGRVLPERPAADLDWLVRAASAALVPRFATGATLVLELGLVWMMFLPRRWRIVCFFIVTAWQIRRHSHGELHVPELPGAGAGSSAAG